MKTGLTSVYLFALAIFILAGCAVKQDRGKPPVCRADCRVDINLPNEPADLHIEGGTEVNFRIQHGKPDSARTVLSFEQPALLDNQGSPLYTVDLRSGNNLYKVSDRGVCSQRRNGCRYVIIDVGRPDEPSIISSPRIIVY